jgi:phosphoribosylformylglycinamidine cyclo-ligase
MAGCSLVGGETAEMPGMYEGEDYDLAGFCVGIAEKSKLIDGSKVDQSDILLGLASSGPHSNGYSLIRKIIEVSGAKLDEKLGNTDLASALMAPTRIYVKPLLELIKNTEVHALSHITGGGLLENIPRVLPENCKAVIDTNSWDLPDIFKWLKQEGNVAAKEMYRTFNCGVGMVIAVPAASADSSLQLLKDLGENVWKIGHIAARNGEEEQVELTGNSHK